MRALLILLLVSSTTLFAQTPEEKREQALYEWRVAEKWERLSPADKAKKYDDYVKKYTEVWNQYATEQLAAMAAACPENTDCVPAAEKDQLNAQVRISIGLVNAKSKWIKEGKTEAEQKTAEDNYNKCARENKDCEKLPESERNSAREARGSTTVVVTPSVTTDISDGKKKVADEIKAMEDAYSQEHEGWKDKELTTEVKDFLISLQNARLEKNLAMLKELCTKYPDNKDVCLTEEQISKLKEKTLGSTCMIERMFRKKSAKFENHEKEWNDLVSPKTCQTLLDLDAKAVVTPDVVTPDVETVVVEEGDDEKSPRNYKAETCKWVNDLPRKIVNGPSCGKTRSKICTGYVVCEQKEGGGKFIRMSTCGPDKCGGSDADAVRCTKDQGYFSMKPAGESKLFMTPKLKKILSGSAEPQ